MTDHNSGAHTATVEALTATVMVMKVGSRQVTMSVFNQLDYVEALALEEVFGRVNPKGESGFSIWVVGRDVDGSLVRSSVRAEKAPVWPLFLCQDIPYSAVVHGCGRPKDEGYTGCRCQDCTDVPSDHVVRSLRLLTVGLKAPYDCTHETLEEWEEAWDLLNAEDAVSQEWKKLPLIVLAGLR